jgi:hypothetical protein
MERYFLLSIAGEGLLVRQAERSESALLSFQRMSDD